MLFGGNRCSPLSEISVRPFLEPLDFGHTWFSIDCNLPVDDQCVLAPTIGYLTLVIGRGLNWNLKALVKPYHWPRYIKMRKVTFHFDKRPWNYFTYHCRLHVHEVLINLVEVHKVCAVDLESVQVSSLDECLGNWCLVSSRCGSRLPKSHPTNLINFS